MGVNLSGGFFDKRIKRGFLKRFSSLSLLVAGGSKGKTEEEGGGAPHQTHFQQSAHLSEEKRPFHAGIFRMIALV